ncbi:ATP-binding protein [Bradyrhizobium septentrionale]|uniref:Novel STAND NTPase 1 domain-containing protein n=2 Tax=Bradyrhizobium septentrionale TaxID=1404411 RepID=A0A974A4V3_9BRAD|nr:ATP-binding protein [Bradyrhizobium septentrionale]UGY16748.1 ATP-binding protein [Bradyrhizobium septentrionale]
MIDDVIERLALQRLVIIHGASGIGKSSLVRAGVLPKLARQHLRHGEAWLTCSIRPSGGPLWNLAKELARLDGSENDLDTISRIVRQLSQRNATLSLVANSLENLRGRTLCILVDQFEELFRFAKETSREEAACFVDLLARQIDVPNSSAAHSSGQGGRAEGRELSTQSAHVILTMRSEFLGECTRFNGLAEAINRVQYLVPRMDYHELVRAICRPAIIYGGEVSGPLADQLIAEADGQGDELPLIQHGLMLLWDEASSHNQTGEIVLKPRQLETAEGLASLLSKHADTVTAEAATSQVMKKAVERIFRALTELNAEGQAIRRPQKFRELVAVSGIDEDALRPIIEALRADGVSFLTPYPPTPIEPDTIVDISHEALIRRWKSIADKNEGWLQREFRDGLIWRSLVEQAESLLSSRPHLLSAATTEARSQWFRDQSEPWANRYGGHWSRVQALLDESEAAVRRQVEEVDQRRQEKEELRLERERRAAAERVAEEHQLRTRAERELSRRRLRYTIVLSAAALLFLLAAVLAFYLSQEATRARIEAERAREIAERAQSDAVLQAQVAKFKAEDADREKQRTQDALSAAQEANAKLNAALTQAQQTQASSGEVVAENRGVSDLLEALKTNTNPYQAAVLGQSIAALGAKITSKQMAVAVDRLVDLLDDSNDPSVQNAFSQSLEAIAQASKQVEATQVFVRRLESALTNALDVGSKIAIAPALQIASSKLGRQDAERAAATIANELSPFIQEFTFTQAEQVATILLRNISETDDPNAQSVRALESVALKLSPSAAQDLARQISSRGLSGKLERVLLALRKGRTSDVSSKLICIGDSTSRNQQCPPEAIRLPCGTDIRNWAKQTQCQILDTKKLADTSGGACGYAIFRVQCSEGR